MATRFYLRKTTAADVNPAFDALWGGVGSAVRRLMTPSTLAGDTLATQTVGSSAGVRTLHRQYVSPPMVAGLTFDNATTYQCYIQCAESAANDNLFKARGIRIFSQDGLTLRHTVWAANALPGGTEWDVTTLESRGFFFAADTPTSGTYVTVAGDRLVVEIGHIDSGGVSISGTTRWGSDSANADLPANETDTTTNKNPWFETSVTISFLAPETVVSVGQAIETDSATALTEQKTIAVGQASYTESAQALTEQKTVLTGQAEETDSATAFGAAKEAAVGQAIETDSAGAVSPESAQVIGVDPAEETDSATAFGAAKEAAVGQAIETDSATALVSLKVILLGLATETDSANTMAPIVPPQTIELGQAIEVDRAQQIIILGGVLVISDTPVLIRAPSKAGRIFHELVSPAGETYHPNVAAWEAEEEAPGGFGPSTGRISERIFRAHRDVFVAGSDWFVFHEDGTCLHKGRLLEPDRSEGEVQLVDRGVASQAEREVGPIVYQAVPEPTHFTGKSKKWTAEFTRMSHSFEDAGVLFTRDNTGDTAIDGGVQVIIPFFGREPLFMRFHVQGSKADISVKTTRKSLDPNPLNSAELDLGDLYENWFLRFTPSSGISTGEAEIDLTLGSNDLVAPFDVLTNVGDPVDTGIGYVYPDCIIIHVGDDSTTSDANRANGTEVLVSNIEVNGVAVGEKRRFSAHDLVADIAAMIGIRHTQIEGGSFDVLPYELPAGMPAAEALDYASLVTGKRYRIRHNGSHAVLEFGNWGDHVWGLASPWAPFDALPQERFDAVSMPFFYGATDLDDHVIVRLENSPLDRRNIYWGLELTDPAHNKDKAESLGARIAEEMVLKRNAGTFAAAELLGPDGEPQTAHHAFAGDSLYPMRAHEPGRLRISHLRRFDDHIEGTFDGGNHALAKMLARRERRLSLRR